ncbi:MAG TPA: hypothetical protein DDW76_18970, partial [Cyanobacteria bacterium UBA11369]|nr:hypothetical protein [Cyanobacteria bacterium UBA11371]HBE50795.1 hypothetical protein [Cyanobacteria bacterium UBA11369]
MSLKPLGFKDSLIPPIFAGQNFKPPLGHLQPLGDSLREPLVQETGDWGFDAGSWEDAGMLSLSASNETASSPLPITNDQLPESSSNPPATTENIVRLKPLGQSKPLAESSDFQLSELSDLPAIVQSQSSSENRLFSSDAEVPNSTQGDRIDISTNVSPIVSATPANTTDSSESLNLPKLGRVESDSLGFNQQLISPFITESQEKSQASFQEIPGSDTVRASWEKPAAEEASLKDTQKSDNLSTETISEQVALPAESTAFASPSPTTIQSKQESQTSSPAAIEARDLVSPTATSDPQAIALNTPTTIQPKSSPTLPAEARDLVSATATSEEDAIASQSATT